MAKYKVVVTDYVFPNIEPEREILEPIGAEVISAQCHGVEELIHFTKDADGILNCYFKPIGEDIFKASPKLKVVVRYGIGIDTIDIPAATKHGVMVANVPDYCLDEVSDHTIALLFALSRKIVLSDKRVKSSDYSISYLKPLFKLRGKTIGFLGFGRIAKLVAEKISAFGFRFIFYDPYMDKKFENAEQVFLDELLIKSDFLLIHSPETEETKHLLNREKLLLMKPTAYIINTARGGIIDTEVLIEMLKTNKLAGAALDVVEGVHQISSEHPFCSMDNVILTPHSAWYSEESIRELQTKAAKEIFRVLRGEKPKFLLNPQVMGGKKP